MGALNHVEFSFNQPSGPRVFVFLEDARRGKLFELLFQVGSEFQRRNCLADYSLSRCPFVIGKDSRINTEGPNVNCLGSRRANAAVGYHMDAAAVILGIA